MKDNIYTPADGFPYYFEWVKNDDLHTLFKSTSSIEYLHLINNEKAAHRYQPGKWSIKQVVGHITDHEKIKMFRAFQLSRNEKVELWGYDQNYLVRNSRFDELSMQLLLNELRNVRKASLSFIETLSESQLNKKGMARQHEITLHDFLKSVIGHERHHLQILRDRYF